MGKPNSNILHLVLFASLIGGGCRIVNKQHKHPTFDSFDFTYNNVFSNCFSIKFTQGDTVYIKRHFVASLEDSAYAKASYYALLSKYQTNKLDSFIRAIDFSAYDSSYLDGSQDGLTYQFYIRRDTIVKTIFVHSRQAPGQLLRFGR